MVTKSNETKGKKCALQKQFEKFLMLGCGFSELIEGNEPDSPISGGLAIMPCMFTLGGESVAQLAICYCTWDSDGELLTTHPLAGLLSKAHIDSMQPDYERCSAMTDLFYTKMLERVQAVAPAGFQAFIPDFFDSPLWLGSLPDRGFDEAAEQMYPSPNRN